MHLVRQARWWLLISASLVALAVGALKWAVSADAPLVHENPPPVPEYPIGEPSTCVGINVTVQNLVAAINANTGARTYCISGSGSPGSEFVPETGDKLIGQGMGDTVIDFTGVPPRLNDGLYYCITGFGGAQDNVTIQDLTVRDCGGDYGTADTKASAIKMGTGWRITRVETTGSGAGLFTGRGAVISASWTHHNRYVGVRGSHGIIQDSEIAHNGTLMDTGGDDGGTKFIFAGDVYLLRNFVHDNLGPGLWFDGHYGGAAVMVGNTVVNNREVGLFYEISRGTDVRAENNIVRANASSSIGQSCFHGGEVTVQNSEGVKILNNTIDASIGSNAICAVDTTRSNVEPLYPETVRGFVGTGNNITLGPSSKVGECGTEGGDYTVAQVFFDANTYRGTDGNRWYFESCVSMNFAAWQGLEQDLGSVLITG
jgi:hypothetical protein